MQLINRMGKEIADSNLGIGYIPMAEVVSCQCLHHRVGDGQMDGVLCHSGVHRDVWFLLVS